MARLKNEKVFNGKRYRMISPAQKTKREAQWLANSRRRSGELARIRKVKPRYKGAGTYVVYTRGND